MDWLCQIAKQRFKPVAHRLRRGRYRFAQVLNPALGTTHCLSKCETRKASYEFLHTRTWFYITRRSDIKLSVYWVTE